MVRHQVFTTSNVHKTITATYSTGALGVANFLARATVLLACAAAALAALVSSSLARFCAMGWAAFTKGAMSTSVPSSRVGKPEVTLCSSALVTPWAATTARVSWEPMALCERLY
jgi:hypothetical protein